MQVGQAFAIPAVPALLPPLASGPRPVFSGTAPAGKVVVFYSGAAEIGRATATPQGTFTFSPSADLASGALVSAATDDYGHQSPKSAAVIVEYETCSAAASCTAPSHACVAGICVGCSVDGDCAGSARGRVCVSSNRCGCSTAADCPGAAPICAANQCRKCLSDGECPVTAPLCTSTGACGACDAADVSRCTGSTPYCATEVFQCAACTADAHCAKAGAGHACLSGRCGCDDDEDCALGNVCTNGTCAAGCRAGGRGCAFGFACDASEQCVTAASALSATAPGLSRPRACSAASPSFGWLLLFVLLLRRRPWLLGIILLVAAADPDEKRLQDAITLYKQGEFGESLRKLEGLAPKLREQAQKRDVRLYSALNFFGLGNVDRARELFREVLDVDPDYELPAVAKPSVRKLFSEVKATHVIVPTADHTPPTGEIDGGAPFQLVFRLQHMKPGYSAVVQYRLRNDPVFRPASLAAKDGAWLATIAVDTPPGPATLEYYLEIADEKGKTIATLRSAKSPFALVLVGRAPAAAPVTVTTPLHKQWWLWTIVGVVVAGAAAGTATAVVLTRPQTGTARVGLQF